MQRFALLLFATLLLPTISRSEDGQSSSEPRSAHAVPHSFTISTLDNLIRRAFASSDANRDNVLIGDEIRAASQHLLGLGSYGLDFVNWGRWEETDRNGDDRIEYLDVLDRAWAALEDLDRNGDGTLTLAERRASSDERLLTVCPLRRGVSCDAVYRKNEEQRLARERSGRAFERLDWWARRYYRFNSGVERPFYGVVQDYRNWHRLWDQITSRHGTKRVNPAVDFGKDMLLVAAAGTKPTGGYGIQITSVRDSGSQLVATAVRTSPGKRCGATAALTSPVDIVRLPRSVKPVRWQFRDIAKECP